MSNVRDPKPRGAVMLDHECIESPKRFLVMRLGLHCMLLGCTVAMNPAAAQQDLPRAAEMTIVRAKCLTCHEADLITQQRLSRSGWIREVEKMVRWGTELTEAEKNTIVEVLSTHFGPRPSAAVDSRTDERGSAIFKTRCLVCHDADLTEQQRLSRAAWMNEVGKMIRWGAEVSEQEKDPLVDFLSRRFGPH